jgi:hypothetical protein
MHLPGPVQQMRETLLHYLELDDRPVTLAKLSNVVQWFLASPAMASIQLREGGHIDAATKDRGMDVTTPQPAARFGWSDQYATLQAESDHARAPQKLLARAIAGYTESVVSTQTIATLRGIPVEQVETELRDAGIALAPQQISWADADDLPDVDVDLAEPDCDLAAPDKADGDGTRDREVRRPSGRSSTPAPASTFCPSTKNGC